MVWSWPGCWFCCPHLLSGAVQDGLVLRQACSLGLCEATQSLEPHWQCGHVRQGTLIASPLGRPEALGKDACLDTEMSLAGDRRACCPWVPARKLQFRDAGRGLELTSLSPPHGKPPPHSLLLGTWTKVVQPCETILLPPPESFPVYAKQQQSLEALLSSGGGLVHEQLCKLKFLRATGSVRSRSAGLLLFFWVLNLLIQGDQ